MRVVAALRALFDHAPTDEWIARFFERLNSHYLSQHPFVAGDQFSIADITALSVVDFAKWVEEKVPSNHVNTGRWYEAVSERPSATA